MTPPEPEYPDLKKDMAQAHCFNFDLLPPDVITQKRQEVDGAAEEDQLALNSSINAANVRSDLAYRSLTNLVVSKLYF